MCGIAGVLGGTASPAGMAAIASAMARPLEHRGPDDFGVWSSPHGEVALSFRRLAIIDVSPAGHQPMTSAGGRYTIVFNGEVYNFEALRDRLTREGAAPEWRGHSDTEVILAAFEAWGIAEAVRRFNGMFAMAVWDERERVLHLVRDRMGVKPLYYGMAGSDFVFGSELRALRAHPDFQRDIDADALALYFRFLFVPAPAAIYRGVQKQAPGTIVSVKPDGTVRTERYWSVRETAEGGVANRFRGTAVDAADELESLLRDAVRLRLIADVPLGVFLSGGIDSSLVTALMQAQATGPVKTFSIGWTERDYDESRFAEAVARHLGTDHTERIVSPEQAFAVVPKLPEIFDEPFADSSQIPTYLVSALARQHVTVSLSGDGGDELFGGYSRYYLAQKLFDRRARVPAPLRGVVGRAILAVPKRVIDVMARSGTAGDRLRGTGRVLAGRPDDLYFDSVSSPDSDRSVVLAGSVLDREVWPSLDDPIERMMFFDQISYLPDDILTKVDRASMSVSLESREPLLDHRLVEFAWTLPLSMKIGGGTGKLLLRDVLRRYIPDEIAGRSKMGFGVPISRWLRGPLRDWAESLLTDASLREHGLLDVGAVRRRWAAHLAGTAEWDHDIWSIVMFQAWFANQANA